MGGRNTESFAFPYWRIFVTFVGVSKKYIVTPKMVTKNFEEVKIRINKQLKKGEVEKGRGRGLEEIELKLGLVKMKEGWIWD